LRSSILTPSSNHLQIETMPSRCFCSDRNKELCSFIAFCSLLVVNFGILLGQGACAQTTPLNPIIPGDHPDPTIIRVGNSYWTASTSGDWAPEFPLYRSGDLRHWTATGAIFPQAPDWASGSFWAPELVNDHGRILVY